MTNFEETIQITFRIDSRVYEKVKESSEAEGLKPTEYIRRAITKSLEGFKCPVCGGDVVKGSRFCCNCGNPLTEEAEKLTNDREKKEFDKKFAVLSKPEYIFAGKSREELEACRKEIDMRLRE